MLAFGSSSVRKKNTKNHHLYFDLRKDNLRRQIFTNTFYLNWIIRPGHNFKQGSNPGILDNASIILSGRLILYFHEISQFRQCKSQMKKKQLFALR